MFYSFPIFVMLNLYESEYSSVTDPNFTPGGESDSMLCTLACLFLSENYSAVCGKN